MPISRHETRCEMMTRFLLGVDEQDSEMVRSTLTEDAETGMVLEGVKMGPPPGREGIVGYLEEFWKSQTDQRRHVLSNAIVESESPEAAVLSFYLTLYATKDRKLRPLATGRYRVRFVSKDGEERIRRIELVLDGPFD
jgi:SnoaL-like domain